MNWSLICVIYENNIEKNWFSLKIRRKICSMIFNYYICKLCNDFVVLLVHKRKLFLSLRCFFSTLKIIQNSKNWVFYLIKDSKWLGFMNYFFKPLPNLFQVFGLLEGNLRVHWFNRINKVKIFLKPHSFLSLYWSPFRL